MKEEFYNLQQAKKHGNKLWNKGYRDFGLSCYVTEEGTRVFFFDWLSEFSMRESIWEAWSH
jgi:hypothetical protein